jgi:hypothetical protein
MDDELMQDEFAPKESALSRPYREGDVTVQIDIYEGDEGGWLLEIVDQQNNTTVWDDIFETEQEALDEALSALEDEGIEAFVGPVEEEEEED